MSKLQQVEWMSEWYDQIIGGTIEEVGMEKKDDEGWPCLLVRGKDGKDYLVQASRDPEGNGPGHFNLFSF